MRRVHLGRLCRQLGIADREGLIAQQREHL